MSTRSLKVFLCGEGKHELGSRSGHPTYQNDTKPGVLATLLRKTSPEGWDVGGARQWKDIGLYSTGDHLAADGRRVMQAAQEARERGCAILAFSRDEDGNGRREGFIREGMERCRATFADGPEVVGGLAVPAIEGWILACKGHPDPESMGRERTTETLEAQGVDDLADMVEAIEGADLAAISPKATSLRSWLTLAEEILLKLVQEQAAEPT